MDIVGGFLDECCLMGSEFEVAASALYGAYKKWAEEAGERSITQTGFGTALAERGFTSGRFTGGFYKGKKKWLGVGLAAEPATHETEGWDTHE